MNVTLPSLAGELSDRFKVIAQFGKTGSSSSPFRTCAAENPRATQSFNEHRNSRDYMTNLVTPGRGSWDLTLRKVNVCSLIRSVT